MAKEEKTSAEKYREERKARLAKAAKKSQKAYNPQAGKIAGKVIAVILVVAIVAGIVAFALNRTGALVKNKVAFKVGDVEITQPEYSYYYASASNQIIEYLSSTYSSYFGISYDSTTTPDKQQYSKNIQAFGFPVMELKEGETATWADYFEFFTKRQIRMIKGLDKLAKEKGIALDESDIKSIDDSLVSFQENIDSNAAENGSVGYSLNGYFREYFGKGVNEKLAKEIMKDQSLANKYITTMTEEIENGYTDKQIEKEYKKNIDSYATISYRSYKFTAETVKDEESGTEAATKDTLAAAKKDAQAFMAAVTDEKSFKSLAAENEKKAGNKDYKTMIDDDTKTLTEDATKETVSSSNSDEKFLDWAFSADTKKGDTYLLEGDDGYTVFMMVAPMHKAPDNVTYDVRHILVAFPKEETTTTDDSSKSEEETTATDTETTEKTTEAETTAAAKTEEKKEDVKVETLDTSKYKDIGIYLDVNADTAKDKATYKKAQDILQKYLDGDHTAEAFEALQNEYSEDTRDESTNELRKTVYENVSKNEMKPEFEKWSLAEGRKEGDVGIVETDYGYHIMYFVKTTTTTWSDTIRSALAAPEVNEIQTNVSEGDDTAITAENADCLADVEDFTMNVLKTRIREQSKSSSASH